MHIVVTGGAGYIGGTVATLLMQAILNVCRQRSIATVVLHASPQGRPVYEKLGFTPTDEMILRLDLAPAT